ncbi:phosphotransferase family protein [Sinorhizobium medicae]
MSETISTQAAVQEFSDRLQSSITNFDPAWSRGLLSYIGGGIESYVFKLRLPTGTEIALKVPMVRYIENDNDQGLDAFDLLKQEFTIASYLGEYNFPVPSPFGLHLPEADDSLGFLASEFITSDRSTATSGDLGALVSRLHHLPPPPSFRPVAQRQDTWDETVALLIRQRSEVVAKLAEVRLREISSDQLLEVLKAKRASVSLLHMDLHPENILCHRGKIRALIDWSNSLVGPPELELYRVAEYGVWEQAFQKRYGIQIKSEYDDDPLSLIYRLYTATMLAVVFLSEAPDPVRAKASVARVRKLYSDLARLLN